MPKIRKRFLVWRRDGVLRVAFIEMPGQRPAVFEAQGEVWGGRNYLSLQDVDRRVFDVDTAVFALNQLPTVAIAEEILTRHLIAVGARSE